MSIPGAQRVVKRFAPPVSVSEGFNHRPTFPGRTYSFCPYGKAAKKRSSAGCSSETL